MELVNEKDWEEHFVQLLGNLLDGLDEQKGNETRAAFSDIVNWARQSYALIDLALSDPKEGLVKYAQTPVDLNRINNLIKARFYLDMIIKHIGAVVYARKVNGDVLVPRAEHIRVR